MDFVTPNITNLLTTVVGFLLFVWVLARFAWGPILTMLDQRRDDIQEDYAAAERNLAEAEQLKGEFESKLQDIKVIEREKVQEAVKRGEDLAHAIVDKAHEDATLKVAKAEQDIELETQQAQLVLRDSVVAMAIGAAEKVVGERLDDELHRKLIQQYIDSIGTNPGTNPGAPMRDRKVATRYAGALLASAKQAGVLDGVAESYADLLAMHISQTDLRVFLDSPQVRTEEKKELLESVFGDRIEPVLLNFLYLLIDKYRIENFRDIGEEFARLVEQEQGVMRAQGHHGRRAAGGPGGGAARQAGRVHRQDHDSGEARGSRGDRGREGGHGGQDPRRHRAHQPRSAAQDAGKGPGPLGRGHEQARPGRGVPDKRGERL